MWAARVAHCNRFVRGAKPATGLFQPGDTRYNRYQPDFPCNFGHLRLIVGVCGRADG